MLYEVIQKRSGKSLVVCVDSFAECRAYMKKMRDSQRGGIRGRKVEYSIQKSESVVKYKKKAVGWYQ